MNAEKNKRNKKHKIKQRRGGKMNLKKTKNKEKLMRINWGGEQEIWNVMQPWNVMS